MDYLLKAIIIGFSIAAPVGPIGVLCIKRTITEGRKVGFITGLGAATADAIYGIVAAFGLTAISTVLVAQHKWIQAIGGIFLLYLGIKMITAKPATNPAVTPTSKLGHYGSTFFLTLTNPMTILSFVAVFAGLGLANTASRGFIQPTLTVIGVFIGSALWWLILSGIVSIFRNRFNIKALKAVNIIAGVIIITFAVIALSSFVRS